MAQEPKKPRFPASFYNPLTYAGVWLAIFAAVLDLVLFVIDFLNPYANTYHGLITYIFVPPFIILGLLLIPFGAFIEERRIKQGKMPLRSKVFTIDPANPKHRNTMLVFIAGTALFTGMSMVGTYKSFHYMESVQFCGTTCHVPMHPEYTAYLNSPHSRVKCIECHVGAGADYYVRSKMTGARQMVKAMTNTFKRPIETPVKELRPAGETCAQCHFPGKYFGTLDLNRDYFLTEGEDPQWHVRLLLNVGAGKDKQRGVHAHMNVDKDIYYAADDKMRQRISWVKVVDKDGKAVIYTSPKSPYKDKEPPAPLVRKMDCIDCHNRPTHQFKPPYRLMNEAMQDGRIDPAIPGIKEKGMELLSKEYKDTDEALAEIRKLPDFYKEKHADYAASDPAAIEKAEKELEAAYTENMFPEMKVRWDTHPDNIGHLYSPGCFRCHDGEHASSDGKVVTRDCNACHVIVEQGPAGALEKNLEGLEYRHPDGGEDWKESSCSDCHTGGA